jgi:hypothetical protein
MPTLQNKIGIVQNFITNGVVDHIYRPGLCKMAKLQRAFGAETHFRAAI